MFAERTALAFFPTYVWVHDLKPEDRAEVERTAIRLIDDMLTPRPPLEGGVSKWQTPTDLQTRPQFRRLNELVLGAAAGILDFLGVQDLPLEITGAWANVSPPGASHHEHYHPNNFLAVVYYPRVPKGGDVIAFSDPRPQAHIIAPPWKTMNSQLASQVNVPVQVGRLVVFPAWLRHSVPPNRGEGERMSIAFNLMFAESLAKPRWSGKHGAGKG
jgi:uncharacterized protein (TIGR02466 family)